MTNFAVTVRSAAPCPPDRTVTAQFKVKDELKISVTAGYEKDPTYDGKAPDGNGGYYPNMYNICLYVTASGPADRDYTYSKEVFFINPVSESNPDDGAECHYSASVILKKGERSAKAIAYTQPFIPNKIWVE